MPIELPRIIQRVTVVTDDAGYKQFIRSVDKGTESLEEFDEATQGAERSTKSASQTTDKAAKSQTSYASAVRGARKETEGSVQATSLLRREHEKGATATRDHASAQDKHSASMRKAHGEYAKMGKELSKIQRSLRTAGQAGGAFLALFAIKLPVVIAGLSLAAQGISALAAGLIGLAQTITPLFNLVGLLPAAIAAAVGGFGALLIAAKPVGEALGAAFKDPAKAGGGGGETARQRARRLADAIKDVERAQESLSDSQRDAERAQIDLNEAYLDATENLRDLRQEQDRGSISVQRAEIAIGRAKENQLKISADSTATESDRLEALLDVKDAELDLKDAQERRVDLARDLHEAEKQGVAGSDLVKDAAERQSDALTAVADAQLALSRAIEEQASPEKAPAAAAAIDEYAEALKNLSPEARKFVETIRGQKGLFKDLRNDVQDALFGPLNQGLAGLFAQAGPLKAFFVQSAAGVGDLGKEVAEAFSGEQMGEDLRTLGAQTGDIFRSLAGPLKDLVGIFTDLAVVGGPFLVQIIQGIGGAVGGFADKISDLRADGGLREIFADAIDRLKQFGRIFGAVFGGIRNIFQAATGLAEHFLRSMETGAEKFRDITGSVSGQNKLADWFNSAKAPLEAFGGLLQDVFKLFVDISAQETLTTTIDRIRDEGLPILKTLFDSVGPKFIDKVLDLAFAFGRFFSEIAGQSGPLLAMVGAFAKLFEVLGAAFREIPLLKDLVAVLVSFKAAFIVLSLAGKVTGLGALWSNLSKLTGLTAGLAGVKEAFLGLNVAKGAGASLSALGGSIVALAPSIGILVGLGAVLGTVAYFYGKWKDRKQELERIREGFVAGLRDEDAAVRDIAATVAEQHLVSKNQADDIARTGKTYDDLGDALARGQDGMRDIREAAITTGEVVIEVNKNEATAFDQTERGMDRARDAFIRTGQIIPGFVTSNDGLVRSYTDLGTQIDKVAEKELDRLIAIGRVDQAQVDALQTQLRLEAAMSGIDPALITHTEVLNDVRTALQEMEAEYRNSIQAVQDLEDEVLSGLGTSVRRDRSSDDAFEAQEDLNKATLDYQALLRKKGVTPEEIAEGYETLETATQRNEDAILAAAEASKSFAASQATVVDETADAATQLEQQGRRSDEIIGGMTADMDALRQKFSAQGFDTSFIDTVIEELKNTDVQIIAKAELQLLPLPSGFTLPIKGKLQLESVGDNGPAAQRALAAGREGPDYSFGASAASPQVRARAETRQAIPPATPQSRPGTAPAASTGVTRHYEQVLGAGNPDAPLPMIANPNKPGSNVFPQYDLARKKWYYAYASGGRIGSGFMTNGPRAIVGEGKRQWPEYVIPTDPAHRKNATGLLTDLIKRIGGLAGGGVMGFDPEGMLRAILGYRQQQEAAHVAQMSEREFQVRKQGMGTSREGRSAAMLAASNARNALMRSQALSGGTDSPLLRAAQGGGTHIGRSVGYDMNFAGATFMVHDYDDFIEKMAQEQRKANMAAVSSGRSPKR